MARPATATECWAKIRPVPRTTYIPADAWKVISGKKDGITYTVIMNDLENKEPNPKSTVFTR